MESIPNGNFITTLSSDLSPLFGLNLADQYSDEANVSLVEQLQTTLEIDQILEIFSMEASKTVSFCGLSFNFGSESIAIRGSVAGRHRTSFNITVNNMLLGQLSYNLNEGLSKMAIKRLESLHKQLRYPLRNALNFHRVQKLALKDPLTGLSNRGHFDDSLQKAMLHAKRTRSSFALIMLDLDQFKAVNDMFGHQAGDQVIKAFADILRLSIRGDDTGFRLGGDEYAVIADTTCTAETQIIAERILRNVRQCPTMAQYGVTTSIGFTFYQEQDSLSSIYSRTDQALYAAKDFGRDCARSA